MTQALVIAESQAKARSIGAILRNGTKEMSWKVMSTSGFWLEWPKKALGVDLTDFSINRIVKNKNVLNKILHEAVEASKVYLATEDDRTGEALAAELRRFILEQQPEKIIKRLRFREITLGALIEAIDRDEDIDENLALSGFSRLALDRLVTQKLSEPFTYPIGRAMVPVLHALADRSAQETTITARFASGMFEDRTIEFVSDPIPRDEANSILGSLRADPPTEFTREIEDALIAHPPRPFSTNELLITAIDDLRFRGIEVFNKAQELYEQGFITRPSSAGFGMSKDFVASVTAKIRSMAGKEFCGELSLPERFDKTECIRPTDISRDPSVIPKPVQQIYRMIWARSLAACSVPARVRHEKVSFEVGGYRFEAEGLRVVQPGFDRVGMGMFLHAKEIPDDIKLKGGQVNEAGWPTESELIAELWMLQNPALAIKALENNSFVCFSGLRIEPTEQGRAALAEIEDLVPELTSMAFLQQTEFRLKQIAAGEFPHQAVLTEYSEWINHRIL